MADEPTTTNVTREQTGLEKVLAKYKPIAGASGVRENVQARFEVMTNAEKRQRLSRAPQVSTLDTQLSNLPQLWGEYQEYQMKMIDLADTYGKLNLSFRDLLGKKINLTGKEKFTIKFYDTISKIPVVGLAYRNKGKKTWKKAAISRGDVIVDICKKIGVIMDERHERAKQMIAKMRETELYCVQHMRTLDMGVIEDLRSSYTGTVDYATVMKEIDKYAGELKEIDDVLQDYETKVMTAKAAADVEQVKLLTDEMVKVLDVKYDLMENKRATEGAAAEIRRQFLDKTTGIKIAKESIAASMVNYITIQSMLDSFYEQEILFRHIKEKSLPVFIIQGQIAAGLQEGFKNKDVIKQYADITSKMMELLPQIAAHLDAQTWELFTTPIYDITVATQIKNREEDRMKKTNAMKMQYAELQQSAVDIQVKNQGDITIPHYAAP